MQVALMFLTRGPMPLEPVWREFMEASAMIEPINPAAIQARYNPNHLSTAAYSVLHSCPSMLYLLHNNARAALAGPSELNKSTCQLFMLPASCKASELNHGQQPIQIVGLIISQSKHASIDTAPWKRFCV